MTALDEACRELAELAKVLGYGAVGLHIDHKGGVFITVHGRRGGRVATIHASVNPRSPLELPSAALAERGGR